MVSTTLWLISTPKTFVPCDAINAEVGNPMYPKPIVTTSGSLFYIFNKVYNSF